GLAMSAVLQRRGVQHVVIERRQIGERWMTERWESLRFQFPNWSLELPGYAYDGGQPEAFAHWSEILRIIQGYAAATGAPVREETDVYWWLDRTGRLAQTIDGLPGRQWPPSTVVTGVAGGYDVDVRAMAAEGVTVLGRVVAASHQTLTLAGNANEVLDEADASFA